MSKIAAWNVPSSIPGMENSLSVEWLTPTSRQL
jgi:hypothetical protein